MWVDLGREDLSPFIACSCLPATYPRENATKQQAVVWIRTWSCHRYESVTGLMACAKLAEDTCWSRQNININAGLDGVVGKSVVSYFL